MLFLTKTPKTYTGKNTAFVTKDSWKTGCIKSACIKMKLDPCLPPLQVLTQSRTRTLIYNLKL
jgi:hypothetical protein